MGYDAVVDSARLNGALTATAEAIRSKTDSAEPVPFDMDKGFKAAVESIELGGDTEAAYNEGVEAGKQAEYDAFWDALQQNGIGGIDYRYKFFYWANDAYKPKYPIWSTKPSVMYAFANAGIENTIVDVNLSDTTTCTSMFAFAMYLHTIPKLIVAEQNTFDGAFQNCSRLVNITVEGTFGNNIDFQWSTKLSKASITSIINCLSITTTGKTVTFSKAAKETAFTADEWAALANTRPNWTITLV